MITLSSKELLPEDGTSGTLVGRVWLPQLNGPAVVAVRADGVFDVTARFATVSALCEEADPKASPPTRRPTGATGKNPGCSPRSICRC